MSPLQIALTTLIVLVLGTIGHFYQKWRYRKRTIRLIKDRFAKPPQKTYTDRMDSIQKYWQTMVQHHPEYRAVDDITWNDLEFDLLFQALNTTWSSVGSEVLYARLHRLDGTNPDELVEAFQDETLRTEVAYTLKGLGKVDYNYVNEYLFDPGSQKTVGFFIFQPVLPLLGVALLALSPPLGLLTIALSIIWNTYTRYRVNRQIEHGAASVRYIAQAIVTAQHLAKLLAPTNPAAATRLTDAVRPIRRIPVRMASVVHLSDATNMFAALMNMLNGFFLLDILQYNRALSILVKAPDALAKVWEAIGDIEIGLMITGLDRRLPTTRPVFEDAYRIAADDIVHPLIENAIPNPVDFSSSILVSGSNASGKSTYVKAIALSAITAQNLGRAFAKDFHLKPGRVITSMAIRDNLYQGDSYFVAEIKSLRRMIEIAQTEDTVYLFIDEILKGTNTIERIASSNSLLNWFHAKNILVISATHDIELTELQAGQMTNIHFRETVNQDEIVFDYQIKPGPTQTTNAINLLKYYGFPSEITDQANQMADQFKTTRLWQTAQDS